jgi:hypothetical protein
MHLSFWSNSTRMKYINKEFVIISFCAVFLLLCAAFFFSGDSTQHGIQISNSTGEVILLEGIVVDGKSIFNGTHKISPLKSYYDPANYTFIELQQSNGPKNLELFVRTADDSKSARYICELKDEQGCGCLFVVNIRDTKDITCFCQSRFCVGY